MAVKPNDILRSCPSASSSKQLMNAAALDIAFDVFLAGMRERDLFEACDIAFKGGTALRKFRLGHKSRISFDLDFAIADGGEDMLVEEMTGYDHEGFKFDFISLASNSTILSSLPLCQIRTNAHNCGIIWSSSRPWQRALISTSWGRTLRTSLLTRGNLVGELSRKSNS